MAYTRTHWVSEETALSADNMNNIEDGVEEAIASADIDDIVLNLYANMGWQATS